MKTCEKCGELFEAGGLSGHKAVARFCSVGCANSSNGSHPEPLQLSATDAAYIAGFLDGEGTIVPTKRERVTNRSWRISIYQCDEPVIRWIAEVTGTGLVVSREPRQGGLVGHGNFKLGWVWQLYGRNAALFLIQLLPYLKVKKGRAEEMVRQYL